MKLVCKKQVKLWLPTTMVMWRHNAYRLTNVGVNKELKEIA
jgi:hypothetical protein